MRNNIVGYSPSENNHIKPKEYDPTIEVRQVELEEKINSLILDFQEKEKVVVLIDYDIDNYNTTPIEIRLIIDLKS